MSSQPTSIAVNALSDTTALSEAMGQRLQGGEVIELVSDVGGGKTTFVQGLAAGMGSTDTVTSPSFTVSNQYQGTDLTLYHFDFYRLSEPGIMANELAEIIADPKAVTVIEWADIVENILPSDHVRIQISVTGEHSRNFVCDLPEARAYLLTQENEAC